VECVFAKAGFDGYKPCKTIYHTQCIRVGTPFISRRDHQQGLHFPNNIQEWPNFICEACAVRQVIGRELHGPQDIGLLALERMRILDMVSSWAKSTHSSYQTQLRLIRKFEDHYGFHFLNPTKLQRPPGGPTIPLMWCMESHSTLPGITRRASNTPLQQSYNTIRHLRSAASQYWAWDLMMSNPGASFMTKDCRILRQKCRPSDGLDFSIFTKRLWTRIGEESQPSVALLDQHVRAMETEVDLYYRHAHNPLEKCKYALGGFALLLFWLGWLRSGEVFNGTWDDCRIYEPKVKALRLIYHAVVGPFFINFNQKPRPIVSKGPKS